MSNIDLSTWNRAGYEVPRITKISLSTPKSTDRRQPTCLHPTRVLPMLSTEAELHRSHDTLFETIINQTHNCIDIIVVNGIKQCEHTSGYQILIYIPLRAACRIRKALHYNSVPHWWYDWPGRKLYRTTVRCEQLIDCVENWLDGVLQIILKSTKLPSVTCNLSWSS